MKKCPTCNRTFEDTFTFCLVDGSILSPPFDSEATQRLPTISPDLPSTQIASSLPTIASPAPQQVTPFNSIPLAESSHKSNWRPWVIGSFIALLAISIAIVAIIYKKVGVNEVNNDKSNLNLNTVDTSSDNASNISSSNSNQITQNTLSLSNNNPRSSNAIASRSNSNVSRTSSSISSNSSNTLNKDDSLPSEMNGTKEIDYSKVFSPREVTQKARILSKPEPTYTEEARRNQISGTIVLRMVLSASGQVTNISAVNGLPYGLTERAVAAASQIRFTPAMKDGRAVSQNIQIEYNFNLY
jgi:TonB family protein